MNYQPNEDGTFTKVTTLSGPAQHALDLQGQLAGVLGQRAIDLGNSLPSGAIPTPNLPNAADFDGRRASDAVFNQAKMYLDPMYEQSGRALDQSLHDRGLAPGSEGEQIQRQQYGDQKGRDYQSAAYTAVGAGNQEAQRQFQNTYNVAQQDYTNRLTARSEPYQELAALIGNSPQLPTPQFSPTWQAPTLPTDTISPTIAGYQGQMNAYNAQQQRDAAGKGALGGLAGNLGGAAIGNFGRKGAASLLAGGAGGAGTAGALQASALGLGVISDRRMKTDIRRVGTLDNGLAVYAYRYVWGGPTQIGVMADEAEILRPDAVVTHSGIKMVDYDRAVS